MRHLWRSQAQKSTASARIAPSDTPALWASPLWLAGCQANGSRHSTHTDDLSLAWPRHSAPRAMKVVSRQGLLFAVPRMGPRLQQYQRLPHRLGEGRSSRPGAWSVGMGALLYL